MHRADRDSDAGGGGGGDGEGGGADEVAAGGISDGGRAAGERGAGAAGGSFAGAADEPPGGGGASSTEHVVGRDAVQVAIGENHTCVLLKSGAVRCWGRNQNSELGYQRFDAIGDDEVPASAGDLDIGGVATQLAAAAYHNCVLLEGGAVRCWGTNAGGRLGYGNGTNIVGDNETPASVGDVDLATPATQIATGFPNSCALLEGGKAHCWGDNLFGGLGQGIYGEGTDIGDNELASSIPDVPVAGTVAQIAAGGRHICVLLEGGAVRCWGKNASGQLGYANTEYIGDDETAASAGEVDVGGAVVQLSAGNEHTCALLASGNVRCWGDNVAGQLGYGNTLNVYSPATAGDVDVGGKVTQIVTAAFHTCALLESGAVRCWGHGEMGQLGYANTEYIGDDESPASAGDVDVGPGKVRQLALGDYYTCALFEGGALRCWGSNYEGRLGYGNDLRIGDDETPASAGDVQY